MTTTQAIIFRQLKARYEKAVSELQETKAEEDVFAEANITGCTKYISRQGQVRLDIDFDTFQELFNQSNWNWAISLTIVESDLKSFSKQRLIDLLYFISEYYSPKRKTAECAEIIRKMAPLFDYREKPR